MRLPFSSSVFTSTVSVFCKRQKENTLWLVRVVALLCTVQTLRWVLLALGLAYSLQRFLHWWQQSLLNCPPRFVNAFDKLKPAPLSVLKQWVWRRWLLKNNLAYVINHPPAEQCVPRAKKHDFTLQVFQFLRKQRTDVVILSAAVCFVLLSAVCDLKSNIAENSYFFIF